MLLNTEELLALANGDVEADRLADLLDRLEECPESAAALQVLVSLKANREEALEALRIAADSDAASPAPFPRPDAQPTPSTGWVTQGLRLAASIAVVGILGVWAASSFFPAGPGPAHDLAITEFDSLFGTSGADLTSSGINLVGTVNRALADGRYEEARNLLAGNFDELSGTELLLLGMSQYWLKEYEPAVATLRQVQDMAAIDDSGVRLQALWYEANALLALDRPWAALPLVEQVVAGGRSRFESRATTTYDRLCALLGINNAGQR